MHPNRNFRNVEIEKKYQLLIKKVFGSLIFAHSEGILISHVPFLLDESGESVEMHLVRSNPILRYLDTPKDVVLTVQGPDAYISPDWYGVPDQVPTWNYVAVHVRGKLERLPQDDIRGVLERLSAAAEARLAPKKPWTIEKMTPEVFDKMTRQIVPVKLTIDQIEKDGETQPDMSGTWKLSQNKPDEVRHAAIKGLKTSDIGTEIEWLRALMRAVDE